MTELELLTTALRRDFQGVVGTPDRAWFRPLSLRILDCVLSLRRTEGRPVAPQLEAFRERFPTLDSVAELAALINTYRTPSLLARDLFDTADPAPAITLAALVDYLNRMALSGTGSEASQLKAWAACARPQDHLTLRVPGLGLAGFQHLRMLLGANTTRPDLNFGRYVAAALGRPVSDVEALLLLEEAAPLVPLRLRDLTSAHWGAHLRVSQPGVV